MEMREGGRGTAEGHLVRVKSLKNMLEGPCGYLSSRSLNAADINLTLLKQEVTGSSSKHYCSGAGAGWESVGICAQECSKRSGI